MHALADKSPRAGSAGPEWRCVIRRAVCPPREKPVGLGGLEAREDGPQGWNRHWTESDSPVSGIPSGFRREIVQVDRGDTIGLERKATPKRGEVCADRNRLKISSVGPT